MRHILRLIAFAVVEIADREEAKGQTSPIIGWLLAIVMIIITILALADLLWSW